MLSALVAESGKTDARADARAERVHVSLAYPHDVFEHGIEGVEAVTRDGVHVAAAKLDELREAASRHGLKLHVRRQDAG